MVMGWNFRGLAAARCVRVDRCWAGLWAFFEQRQDWFRVRRNFAAGARHLTYGVSCGSFVPCCFDCG